MASEHRQLHLFSLPPAKSETLIESFKIGLRVTDQDEKKLERDKKRYYFHRQLKGKYPIDPDKMTIGIPYDKFSEIPKGDRYYINQLFKLGYNVQIELVK